MEREIIKSECQKCGAENGGAAEILEIATGRSKRRTSKAHEIMFVVEGRVAALMEDGGDAEMLMDAGAFTFLPMGASGLCRAVDSDATLLFVRVSGELPDCMHYRINESLGRKESGPCVLMANDHLRHYVDGVVLSLRRGLGCVNYMKHKVAELYFLLPINYDKQELTNFFAHISTPDFEFTEFVRLNFVKLNTAKAMAQALGMSIDRFNYKFKKTHGMPPSNWMREQKANLIRRDISQSDKPFKAIGFEFGFSAQSHFVRYCKATFGTTPSRMRKKTRG